MRARRTTFFQTESVSGSQTLRTFGGAGLSVHQMHVLARADQRRDGVCQSRRLVGHLPHHLATSASFSRVAVDVVRGNVILKKKRHDDVGRTVWVFAKDRSNVRFYKSWRRGLCQHSEPRHLRECQG